MNARVLAGGFLILLSTATVGAWGQVQYQVTDLGMLRGGIESNPRMNDLAQVVCGFTTGNGAVSYLYSGGSVQVLATLPGMTGTVANGINNSGQIVGYDTGTNSAGQYGFVYSGGSMSPLPGGRALAVNDSGQIVGVSDGSGFAHTHAFLFSGGSVQDLGALPGGNSSGALAVSNKGDIVGASDVADNSQHAFLFSGGSMQDLGVLPGKNESVATGVNNAQQVVGYSGTSGNGSHAFLWSSGTGMQDLGTLNGYDSQATAINNAGQVVGLINISGVGSEAVVYSNGTMKDLNTLLLPGSDWWLQVATDINNNGQICGYGINPTGQQDIFVLTPVPEPSTFALLGGRPHAAGLRLATAGLHRIGQTAGFGYNLNIGNDGPDHPLPDRTGGCLPPVFRPRLFSLARLERQVHLGSSTTIVGPDRQTSQFSEGPDRQSKLRGSRWNFFPLRPQRRRTRIKGLPRRVQRHAAGRNALSKGSRPRRRGDGNHNPLRRAGLWEYALAPLGEVSGGSPSPTRTSPVECP